MRRWTWSCVVPEFPNWEIVFSEGTMNAFCAQIEHEMGEPKDTYTQNVNGIEFFVMEYDNMRFYINEWYEIDGSTGAVFKE